MLPPRHTFALQSGPAPHTSCVSPSVLHHRTARLPAQMNDFLLNISPKPNERKGQEGCYTVTTLWGLTHLESVHSESQWAILK